jgi:O-antigen/teichoic acid export membrane protein
MQLSTLLSRGIAVLKGPIARGSAIGLSLRLGGLALMFVQAVIAARLLGAEQYGVVTLLLSIVQIAAAFALMGFGSFAVAEIPRGAKQGKFLSHAAKRIAGLSLLVLPATYWASFSLLGQLEWYLALPLLLTIPVLAGIQLFRGVALGLGRPFWGVAPGEVIRPALLVAALIITALFVQANSALFIALYMGTAVLALCIALPAVAKSKIPVEASQQNASSAPKRWDRAALPFLGIHLATILQLELATLMLGLLATPEAVGLFQPIARISMLLTLPSYALSVAFNPRISALYAQGNAEEIRALAHKHTLAATFLVTLGGLAIGLCAPFLLWLFGSEFAVAAPLVWFLVAGRIALCACGPGAELLAMTGRSSHALFCLVVSLATEALLAAFLIPAYGLAGVAVAVALGLALRGALLAAASRSALKIGLSEFWRPRRELTPSA